MGFLADRLRARCQKLGLEKKCNPHWLRHSGLSYCVNELNYNEKILMWRAGWKNTTQAKRYIHSEAKLERKAYLERQGYRVEDKKPEIIKPKPCPHCNQLNPYTGVNCNYCGMPLDLEEYKEEIEKKRFVETAFENLQKIAYENLEKIDKYVEIANKLSPQERKAYLTVVLGTLVKSFLSGD